MTADPSTRSARGLEDPAPAGSPLPAGARDAAERVYSAGESAERADPASKSAERAGPASSAAERAETWCPSARPEPGSVVFAVRTSDPQEHGVRYLDRPVPVSADVLDLAGPVDPREVFRFGAPCATTGCAHFTGTRCSLVQRIVEQLEPAVSELPPCRLRARCRWFAEEAGAACLRCPVILTLQPAPTQRMARAAAPVALGMPAVRR